MGYWLAFPVIVLLVGLVLVQRQQRSSERRGSREIANLLMVVVAFLMAVGLILQPLEYPVAFAACWLAVAIGAAGLLVLAGWDAGSIMRQGATRRRQLRQELRTKLSETAARRQPPRAQQEADDRPG
ncbi:MAG: hypothetical protein K1X74_06565 [Pirellulales bacterium]|nr:hypothetical protein [Pirellulales bacterium]